MKKKILGMNHKYKEKRKNKTLGGFIEVEEEDEESKDNQD